MISVFTGIPQSIVSLPVKPCLIGFLTLSTLALSAQQDDPDRPHLNHRTEPIVQTDPLVDESKLVSSGTASGTPIGDGLALPSVGHVWAKDSFDGRPELVQMKYVPTEIDNHPASNLVKENVAPFIYQPKGSVEIKGAASNLRLHDPNLSIYIRGFAISVSDDAADPSETSTQMDLTVLKLEPKKDRRVISTIAFTQVTGKASRSSQVVAVTIEKVRNTDWEKVTPNEPLPPGEYALMSMPRGKSLFPAQVFDFAIDPKAPSSPNAIAPATASPSQ